MTDKDRRELHRLLLVSLREIGEHGRSVRLLVQDARSELGLELTEDLLTAELRQLADRGLVAPLSNPVLGTRWIITSRGEQTLAEAGL